MIGTLALAWTGVVAAATFAIGARSRLREVGLVAATGGTQRQVRRLLLADGLVLGFLGSVLGLVVGLVLAVPVVDFMARSAERDPGPLRIPLLAELGAVALGTTAAVLAARWPTVRAARLPTQAALQSRITRPPRRARATVAGFVAMGSGGVVLAYGASADAEVPIVVGTMFVVAGVAMLHRLLVDIVARMASRAPLALRFVARDASRQASRTGPAVVASMLALAAAIGAATIISTTEARDAANPQQRGFYPPNRLEVGVRAADGTGQAGRRPRRPGLRRGGTGTVAHRGSRRPSRRRHLVCYRLRLGGHHTRARHAGWTAHHPGRHPRRSRGPGCHRPPHPGGVRSRLGPAHRSWGRVITGRAHHR